MKNGFKYYFSKTLTLPPSELVRRVAGKIKRIIIEKHHRLKDQINLTYSQEYPQGDLYAYLHRFNSSQFLPNYEIIAGITKHYLKHRFDLLGSGWVQVKHGMNCRGLESYRYNMGKSVNPDPEGLWLEDRINDSNLKESKQIWKLIAYNNSKFKSKSSNLEMYNPIDWQLDFKSGYCWSERTWYKDIVYGHKPGVDVKLPWELSRMQHLPQLALAYALATEENPIFAQPQVYLFEFRNEVLDFIATNPPRFGVNWHCTMDVGIRIVNWLIAFDLFRAFGAMLDNDFLSIFSRSIYEHGRHIVANLEWSETLRSNHYFSNIAGLLFVSAYLPSTPETDAWLAFSVQELVKEVKAQFNIDGTNFEASTSYHCLVAQTVIYTTAIVLGLNREKKIALKKYDHSLIKVNPGLKPSPLSHYPLSVNSNLKSKTPDQNYEISFPSWYLERLEKMAEFTMHITKPDGHIPQIGDNDSGRFLKLHPVYQRITGIEAKAFYANLEEYNDLLNETVYWDEDYLNHNHLVAAINGLFEREDFAKYSGGNLLETYLIRTLAGDIRFPSYHRPADQSTSETLSMNSKKGLAQWKANFNSLPKKAQNTLKIPLHGSDLRDNLKLYAYPDFGLYLFRSKRLYLAIRCGPIGQNDNGGHAHNDQLSLELTIDGRNYICDPGTYLYTPLPARRNEYRSVNAHFSPQLSDKEPGSFNKGLFCIGDEAQAECLYFDKEGWLGVHHGYGSPVYRIVRLLENAIHIIDYTEGNKPLKDICWHYPNPFASVPYSKGYGQQNA